MRLALILYLEEMVGSGGTQVMDFYNCTLSLAPMLGVGDL